MGFGKTQLILLTAFVTLAYPIAFVIFAKKTNQKLWFWFAIGMLPAGLPILLFRFQLPDTFFYLWLVLGFASLFGAVFLRPIAAKPTNVTLLMPLPPTKDS